LVVTGCAITEAMRDGALAIAAEDHPARADRHGDLP
jgi:hypothetical protein